MSKPTKEQEECDHEWKVVDASFDHEFGTEHVFYEECELCGLTRPHHPGEEEV